MVFFIPVILAVAGIAVYKERKDRKRERRELEAEATGHSNPISVTGLRGHGDISYDEAVQNDPVPSYLEAPIDTPPAYEQNMGNRLNSTASEVATMEKSHAIRA